jgi:hypothetical protein
MAETTRMDSSLSATLPPTPNSTSLSRQSPLVPSTVSSSSSTSSPFYSLWTWLIRPNPYIYYRGIAILYTVASIIAVGLYGWEKYNGTKKDNQPPRITEWDESWNGTYLVVLPYVPGLLWILLVMALDTTTRRRTTSVTSTTTTTPPCSVPLSSKEKDA